jgi:hypothetical protein
MRCQDAAAVRSLIGARRRTALSTVGTSWITARPAELTLDINCVKRAGRWPGGTSGASAASRLPIQGWCTSEQD